MNSWYRWDGMDLTLALTIQPRASCNAIVGIHHQRLKIRLTASPVDDQANKQLIKFLAKTFGVTQKQITLLQGTTSRYKIVHIKTPQLPKTLDRLFKS